MKNYDIGLFRNKCDISTETLTTNENGFEVKEYVVKHILKCYVEPITTREYFGANRNGATLKTKVVTRKKNNVTIKDSLVIDGERFNIVNVTREPNSMYMELLVEKRI